MQQESLKSLALKVLTRNSGRNRDATFELHDPDFSRGSKLHEVAPAPRPSAGDARQPIRPLVLPLDAGAMEWRRWFHALADHRAMHGRRTLAEAMRLAHGEALNEWHRRHGAKPDPARCAGCRKPIGGDGVLALPDGARVHAGADWPCLAAYGALWRQSAADGLGRLGIAAPEGSDA